MLNAEKPLKDWLAEILNNCLGFFTFSFGKIRFGVRGDASAVEAFTTGNIVLGTLNLSEWNPSFNHLTVNFADEDYAYQANNVEVYDIDHAVDIAGADGPQFLKANFNLVGTFSKSQAGRIAAVRLREEIGGTTAAERKNARRVPFKTTAISLAVYPGQVCSMTHEDMPGGAGNFRVTSWKLNKDFSIDIQGRTVTPSMYDLVTYPGPKPADISPSPVPDEILTDMVPGDVRPIGQGEDQVAFIIHPSVALPNGDLEVVVEYDPPDPIGPFAGVYPVVEKPDGSLLFPGDQIYNGDPDAADDTRHGRAVLVLPSPTVSEEWYLSLVSISRIYRKTFYVHDDPLAPSPFATLNVEPGAIVGGGNRTCRTSAR